MHKVDVNIRHAREKLLVICVIFVDFSMRRIWQICLLLLSPVNLVIFHLVFHIVQVFESIMALKKMTDLMNLYVMLPSTFSYSLTLILFLVICQWKYMLCSCCTINVINDNNTEKSKKMFVRTNMLIRKFHNCSTNVKIMLFKTFCICCCIMENFQNWHS